MTTKEAIKLLDKIYWERMLNAHHDSDDLQQPDLEALNIAINLIKFLQESSPSDTVKIAELFKAAGIER